MIEGVSIRPLRVIPDERGMVMHMLRRDDSAFREFGEIYFSWVYPGVIKGWHLHTRMTLNYAVPIGAIKLVCYDTRAGSTTHGTLVEIFTGAAIHQYGLITIPPGVWNAVKGVGAAPAMIANCATEPHDPAEIMRADPFGPDVPYVWDLKHG